MPIALIPIIAGGATALAAWAAKDVTQEFIKRKVHAYFNEYADEFFAAAAGEMGVELSESGQLTDESLTAVINTKFLAGSGVQIDSLLDRDKLRAGLERVAITKLANEVGVPVGEAQTIGGVKAALQQWAGDQVKVQLDAESGAVFESAAPSQFIAKVITDAPKTPGWNVATDMTAKGVANRARQAKYRSQHTRTWVLKNEG
jgi:hypothetical protein